MRNLVLIISAFILSCSGLGPASHGEISWSNVQGTSWGYTEDLSIYQSVHHIFEFGKDTIYLTKIYYNPAPKTVTIYNNSPVDSVYSFTVYVNGKIRIISKFIKSDSTITITLPAGITDWIRYIKGPVYNKHYENDPVYNTPNLVYTWAQKEYADPSYQIPVVDNSIVSDWFLWKIDENGHLLMGYVDLDRTCYYWEFTKE